MLGLSDRSIEEVIAILANKGIEAGYLVPTSTGLEKSILDAHAGLRDYFRLKKFHDYAVQAQGTAGKRLVAGFFVTASGMKSTNVSLYRPTTKTGDPRIWMYGLKDHVQPGNLLVVLVHEDVLYIINASDRQMLTEHGLLHPHLDALLQTISKQSSQVAMELLGKLEGIAREGWIPSLRSGATGVGFTLETKLGIQANSSKAPDYKGIEIKAGRVIQGRSSSRTTLFSKTPDWAKSAVHNGLELLDAYGYRSPEGRLQLYCSLNHQPNTLGHYLQVQEDDAMLHAMYQKAGADAKAQQVLRWSMDELRLALAEKHKETFWVKAKTKQENGQEWFHYTEVTHTRGPLLGNMVEMLKLGHIELDYLLHEAFSDKGQRKSRDHGYLFKMWQKHLPSLFPAPTRYSLL